MKRSAAGTGRDVSVAIAGSPCGASGAPAAAAAAVASTADATADATTADATAAENTNLFVLERQAFWSILREQSDIAEALLIMMCQRLRATNELVESVSFLELGPRLARLLLILAARADVDEEGVVTLQSRYTQGELAKRIAASRESVSKRLQADTLAPP